MNILVTGGTVFASRATAEYFRDKGHNVFVLNRGTKEQPKNVTPIIYDRHNLGNILKGYSFDAVIDVCGYNKDDVADLITGLGEIKQYIFVSSSAVYPETNPQPFKENQNLGLNKHWGDYGSNKIKAEEYLISKIQNAYIIRPPYLYGRMNNLYREAFVFDCAKENKVFNLPEGLKLQLQFFDIEDMCRFMEILIEKQPEQHIFNVGNPETIDAFDWVEMCYKVSGEKVKFGKLPEDTNLRSCFPFRNYSYKLDVTQMLSLMPETKPLKQGLEESFEWYMAK